MSSLPSDNEETLINNLTETICQGMVATKEEVLAVEYVLLAQGTAVSTEDVDINTGLDLTQVDWPAKQAMDATIHRV